MSFQDRRYKIQTRSETHFAKPLANLLATVCEPRIDREECPTPFDEAISNANQELRKELQELSTKNGGSVEAITLKHANKLLTAADRHKVNGSFDLLRSAIDRCNQVGEHTSSQEAELPNIERILDESGKPIGLWR